MSERVGPFHYEGTEGFEAWGFTFPSGFTILEWIPDSVPDDEDGLEHYHQSVYHSVADFRRICTGTVSWGERPPVQEEEFPREDEEVVAYLTDPETVGDSAILCPACNARGSRTTAPYTVADARREDVASLTCVSCEETIYRGGSDRVPAVLVALEKDTDPEAFADRLSDRPDVIAARYMLSGLSRRTVEEGEE